MKRVNKIIAQIITKNINVRTFCKIVTRGMCGTMKKYNTKNLKKIEKRKHEKYK